MRYSLIIPSLAMAFTLGCQSTPKSDSEQSTAKNAAGLPHTSGNRYPTSIDEDELKVIVDGILSDALIGKTDIMVHSFIERQLNIYSRAELEVQNFEGNLKNLAAKSDSDPNFEANPLQNPSYAKLLLYWRISHDQLHKVTRVYESLLKLRVDPQVDLAKKLAANLILTEMHQWLEARTQAEKLQLLELTEELQEVKARNPLTSDISDPTQKRKFASVDQYDFAGYQFANDEKKLKAEFKKQKTAIRKLAVASVNVPNSWLEGVEAPQIEFSESRKPSANNPAAPGAGPDGNFFGLGCPTGTFVFTFDDGPKQSSTERLLNFFKTYSDKVNPKMPTTFFVLLQNVRKFPDTVRMEQSMGYGVHDHTFDHPDLNSSSHDKRVMEVTNTIPELKKFLGHDFEFFRCPYGSCVAPKIPEVRQMIADAGLIHAHWAIDSLDWKNIGQPDRTYNLILQQMKVVKRGTILMHDIHDSSVDAAIKVLGYVKQQNDSGAQKIRLVSLEQAVKEYNDAAIAAAKK